MNKKIYVITTNLPLVFSGGRRALKYFWETYAPQDIRDNEILKAKFIFDEYRFLKRGIRTNPKWTPETPRLFVTQFQDLIPILAR